MHAEPGDWLVVKSGSDARHSRRASVLAVGDGGRPPYTVRWLDTGHEALVFPGPDAVVVSAARQLELDQQQSERTARVQAEIVGNGDAVDEE